MEFDLAFIWAGLIALAVLTYVILDGFDLGLGILFPFAKSNKERDLMMNSVAPVWDGNETWLVMGGGGLFAMFPLAYAVIMPALYMPIMLMLLALVFRGVSFEYRWRAQKSKWVWDAAFAERVASGGCLSGHRPRGTGTGDRGRRPRICRWLVRLAQPLLLDDRSGRGRRLRPARRLLAGHEDRREHPSPHAACGSALGDRHSGSDWRRESVDTVSGPGLFCALVQPARQSLELLRPGADGGSDLVVVLGPEKRERPTALFAALGIFTTCFIGLGVSFYPMMVPPSLSIWDAAAPDKSLSFTLVGAAILLPVILAYTAYAYWVFRGKMDPSEGYH